MYVQRYQQNPLDPNSLHTRVTLWIQQNWSHTFCIQRLKCHYCHQTFNSSNRSEESTDDQPQGQQHGRADTTTHLHGCGGDALPLNAPRLGNTVELTLAAEPASRVWAWENWPTLTGYNTWKSGPCALTGQHSGAGSGVWVWRAGWGHEDQGWLSLLLTTVLDGLQY